MQSRLRLGLLVTATTGILAAIIYAQPPSFFGLGPELGRGPGGPNREDRKLLKKFDADENGWLDASERIAARAAIQAENTERGEEADGRRGRRGGPGGRGPGRRGPGPASEKGTPGPSVAANDVASYPEHELYDPSIVRTFFLQFENADWETELEDFHGTDIDIPATLMVDGKTYANVGVHFRGMSSYNHVERGSKRSLNLSLDLVDDEQRLYGYKSLNLLNSHGDPSLMSSVVYSHIARQYIPTPQANFVHVVVNGNSWGVYNSVQQFNKTFLKEHFSSSKGTRWKVPGNPGADGGLRYLGEDIAEYESRFEMKSNDGKKAWKALIALCRTLNETPLDQLQSALEPMLDIEGVLRFLALDVALVNGDGYWTRASDYSLFRDSDGKFHVIPHDMNEAFALSNHGPGRGRGRPGDSRGRGPEGEGRPRRDLGPGAEANRGDGSPPAEADPPPPGRGPFGRGLFGRGPGGRGGPPRHGGVDLDPLVGVDDERMPLRSRLLAVPELRERYLNYVKQIAQESLDWKTLGPTVDGYRDLIAPLVEADTRKLTSYDAFLAATGSAPADPAVKDQPMSYRKFAGERSNFLLKDSPQP